MDKKQKHDVELNIVLEAILFAYGYDLRSLSLDFLKKKLHARRMAERLVYLSELIPLILYDEKFAESLITDLTSSLTGGGAPKPMSAKNIPPANVNLLSKSADVTEDTGSTVTLNVSFAEDSGEVSVAVESEEEPERNKKIMVVDDDERNVFALAMALKKRGLKVVPAKDGSVALDKLESEGDIELVIMDIMMPIMDGYEAMRSIRKNQRYLELPIIALTAKTTMEERNRCIDAGATDFLTKPVDINHLVSMIDVWLM